MHRERWFSKRKVRDCECTHPIWTHGPDLKCRVEGCGCLKFKAAKLPNKYVAVREEIKGRKYDSKFEGRQAAQFDYQIRAGEIESVRPQVTLRLEADGMFICNYKVDFEVTHKDGSIEYVETKGVETPEFKIKKKLMEIYVKHHPGTRYTIVKERRGRGFLRSELNAMMRRSMI